MSIFPGVSDQRYQMIVDRIEPRKDFHRHIWIPVLIGVSAEAFRRYVGTEDLSAPDDRSTEIVDTLVAALEFWDDTVEGDDPRRMERYDFDGAHRFLDFVGSEADDWMDRADRVRPILLKRRSLPPPLLSRLDELYATLIRGNNLAAIALARAILEYMLRDNLSIDGTVKQLIEEAQDVYPALGPIDIDLIRRWGNQIMHPKMSVDAEILPNEDKAIRCMVMLQRIAEIIYRKSKPEQE